MMLRVRWRLHGNRRRRRRLCECDRDQPFNDVRGSRDVDVKSIQQQHSKRKLNENDRGERKGALPGSNDPSWLCVSGHQAPASTLQRV
jgi:hypothetical protein